MSVATTIRCWNGSVGHYLEGCGIRALRGWPSHPQTVRKGVSKCRLIRCLCVRAGKISRIDLDRPPASPSPAVGFSEEDLVWWSEGERIEAPEQVDVDAAAPWETSSSHRIAATGPIRRPAPPAANRRPRLGVA